MIREDQFTEFKRQYVKDILKTVIAFVNTSGGKIYIGLDDNGETVGINDVDSELLKLTNAVRDSIKPDVTTFTNASVEIIEDKEVIVYEVQRGTECPYYIEKKGLRPEGVYVRQGPSSVPASQTAIVKMIKETDGDSYEDLRSLNQQLEFSALEKEFDAKMIPLGKPQMKTLRIIGEDDLYTNLGLLLSEQCQHSIKAAVFEGGSKSIFKDRYEFTGSLLRQMQEVYAFVDRYNRTSSKISGLERIDFREYPEEALREALLNSIVHKDYSLSASTLVSVFDDRIEILTIGGLVKGLTKNDILIGTSLLRNKNLANVFYRLKWIEAYGTGIMKINESYASSDVKPLIEITDNAFKITLPARGREQARQTEKTIIQDLNSNESKIVEMIINKKSIKRRDIEAELSISQPMAVKLLKQLLEKKIIIKIGAGKNVTYCLNADKTH